VYDDQGEVLKAGDVGTIIHVHPGAEAFVVEFMTLDGDTLAIAIVLPSQARPVTDKDITQPTMWSPSAEGASSY
jgi:hypothetical protein